MRSPTLAALLIAASTAVFTASAEPVVVSTSPDPEKLFEIVLSTDKDQPEFEKLEFKGGSFPEIWIRQRATGKLLSKTKYPGDAHSDQRPLKDRFRVNWSADISRVALEISEKGSRLLIFSLDGTLAEPKSFKEVVFPSIPLKDIIPKFKEFRTAGYCDFQGWPGQNLVMFAAGAVVETELRKDGNVVCQIAYSYTYDVSEPEEPVLVRMELMDRKRK